MNNNRWLSLALLIVLLIAGIVGAGYLLFQRNQSEMDKDASLKQIQAYIIEKDHRSAYNLADALVARYPDDENLQSLRKALAELLGEANPFDTAISNSTLGDNGISEFDFEVIEPITPRPDQTQDIFSSNEPTSPGEPHDLPKGQQIPQIREEEFHSSLENGLQPAEEKKAPTPSITPIPRPVPAVPLRPVTPPAAAVPTPPVAAPPAPTSPPAVTTPTPITPPVVTTAPTITPAPSHPTAPVTTEAARKRAEERRIRTQLFEVLDAVQTGNLSNAKDKIDTLLSEGSVDPDFKSVSDLLATGKQREAREQLERLLGSGIVFPSIDQTGAQTPRERVEEITRSPQPASESAPATTPAQTAFDASRIQRMDLKDSAQRNQAKTELEVHLRTNPNDASALGLLASLAETEGDLDKAIALYEQAAALEPKAEDYHALGGLYFHKKQYDKSANAYSKSIAIDPKNTRAYNNLGIDYVMLQKDNKAIESFKKAVANDSRYANGYYQLGRVYKRNGNLDQSLANFQKAYNLDKTRLTYISELAGANLEKGNFAAADNLYTSALTQEPNNESLLYNAAQTKGALRQFPAGLALINRALGAAPANLSYRLVKADILDEMSNKAGAEAEYKAVAAADPQDVLSRVNLGSLYTSQRKYAEAQAVLEEAQAIDPNNGAAQNNLGALLIDQKQYAASIPYLKKASDLGVKEADYNLALAYFEEKNDTQAKATLDKVLSDTPQNWDARYLTGLVEYRMGHTAAGRTRLEQLLRDNPNFSKKAEIEQLLANN